MTLCGILDMMIQCTRPDCTGQIVDHGEGECYCVLCGRQGMGKLFTTNSKTTQAQLPADNSKSKDTPSHPVEISKGRK